MHRYHSIGCLCIFLFYTPLSASWAEKTLATLSRAEKIGQLITMRVEMADDPDTVIARIQQNQIGSVIPLDHHITHAPWSLEKHNTLIESINNLYPNHLQSPVAAYGSVGLCAPLLIIEDSEWGCAMRIPELPAFPRALTLGATHNPDLIYRIGYAIGTQCKTLGVHLNCAPVVDVNSNYNNPVIGMRSFGSDPEAVGRCAVAFVQGLHDAGVLACIKHFPGHGNTDKDSHVQLPIIKSDKSYIEEHDVAPFTHCLKNSAPAVMVGHLAIPALTEKDQLCPATLSSEIIQHHLQQKLGFSGLIISDALDMHALAAYGDPGDIALQALKAGIDLLLCPPDIDAVIKRVSEALDTGEYTEAELDAHVLKILQAKESLSLHEQSSKIRPQLELYEDLIQETYDAAATPCNNFEATRISIAAYESVSIGSPYYARNELPTSPQTPRKATSGTAGLRRTCRMAGHPSPAQAPFYDPAIGYTKPLLVHLYPGGYRTHRLSAELKNMLTQITEQYPGSIVLLFGSPYCFMDIPISLPTAVLYEDTIYTHSTAQKIMAGELKPEGTLPTCRYK